MNLLHRICKKNLCITLQCIFFPVLLIYLYKKEFRECINKLRDLFLNLEIILYPKYIIYRILCSQSVELISFLVLLIHIWIWSLVKSPGILVVYPSNLYMKKLHGHTVLYHIIKCILCEKRKWHNQQHQARKIRSA